MDHTIVIIVAGITNYYNNQIKEPRFFFQIVLYSDAKFLVIAKSVKLTQSTKFTFQRSRISLNWRSIPLNATTIMAPRIHCTRKQNRVPFI